MKYGLIGYPLIHSFSKTLHEKLGNSEYELKQLNSDELEKFIKEKKFLGLNVTIPYKKEVIKYIDYVDENAKSIEAVNTIKNVDNTLYGYNTDVLGFEALLYKNNIDIIDKSVLILGTGATSRTVECILKKLKAKNIYKRKRNGEYIDVFTNGKANYSYDNISLIINTTPIGMYPHVDDDELINLDRFINLEAVLDVVYNPLRTNILQYAQNKNLKIASGLYMLVAQGYFAHKIFFDKSIINKEKNSIEFDKDDVREIDNIYKDILSSKQNIVLIGMPSSGKTTLGELLAKKLGKKFIDIDLEIEKKIGISISDFILKNGERNFREIEKQIIKLTSMEQGVVISTGGGSILDRENVIYLRYNGKLYFINRSIENLQFTNNRPLTNTHEKLVNKYNERLPVYKKVADVEIDGNKNIDEEIELIIDDFYNKSNR